MGKGYGTNCDTIVGIFFMHILGYMLTHLIVWEFLFVTLIIINFYLGVSKSQGTSLWFKLIDLISCDAYQSLFFFFGSGSLWLAHQQKGILNFAPPGGGVGGGGGGGGGVILLAQKQKAILKFEKPPPPKIEVTQFYSFV